MVIFSKASFLDYLITAIFEGLSQLLLDTLTTAFERFEFRRFTEMDQPRC